MALINVLLFSFITIDWTKIRKSNLDSETTYNFEEMNVLKWNKNERENRNWLNTLFELDTKDLVTLF